VVQAQQDSDGAQGMKIAACILAAAGWAWGQEAAQAATGPVTFLPLFTISWSLTANVVHYDAKMVNGKFDPKEPVVAYWVMHQTDGHREPLTFIERMKGYGFKIRPGSEPETWDMVVVSVKKKTIRIARSGEGFEITLPIANCPVARLEKVHVQAHKWHMLSIPDYAEMAGTDVRTGEECREKVKHE